MNNYEQVCEDFNDYGCGCGWCHDCPHPKDAHKTKPTEGIHGLDEVPQQHSWEAVLLVQKSMKIESLEKELRVTRRALERLLNNSKRIFDKFPVRDWAETLAEAESALGIEAARKDME